MTQSTKPSTDNKSPTHTVYAVIDGRTDTDDASWTPVSGAWAHQDGQGFSFSLGKLRLVLRPKKARASTDAIDLSVDAEVTL